MGAVRYFVAPESGKVLVRLCKIGFLIDCIPACHAGKLGPSIPFRRGTGAVGPSRAGEDDCQDRPDNPRENAVDCHHNDA